MKSAFPLLFLPAFALLGQPPALAQITPGYVDSLMNKAMDQLNVAGAALGVVKENQVLVTRGYGTLSVNAAKKVDEQTLFAIGSNSKAFTTAALGILVDEGKLGWEDRVVEHIPEFTMYNDYVRENFNIEDLLTHRSGLGMGVGDLMIFPGGTTFTIDDLLKSFQHFEPVSPFRTKYDYDNLLYMVAGEVIERVSGMSWEEFISKRILQPLQMERSAASLSRIRDRTNLAEPHISEDGSLKVISQFELPINGAAGGIFSNVEDMCRWMLVQLQGGLYGPELGQKLFSGRAHQNMWRIHTVKEVQSDAQFRYNTHFSGYGLGWELSDVKGNMLVAHTGGLPGMVSKVMMVPDQKLGVVILTNTSPDGAGLFTAVAQCILDRALGLDEVDWISQYAAFLKMQTSNVDKVTDKVWEEVEKADASRINEKNYVGMYKDDWFGRVEIFKKGDQLWVRCLKSPQLNGPMYYYKDHTFAVRWEFRDSPCDVFAIFEVDRTGKAQELRMKGISPNIDFSFDFQDLELKRVE